jgi:phosphopantothenoylcysteine decarboxylase/phosphopantothenate--cysteine ligase
MKILFVVTGGIAEYKVVEAVRFQVKAGNQVKVVMTQMAKQFVTPLTFATLTNDIVYDSFEASTENPVAHIALADWADQIVIAPATANFIGKMANGIADDFASTVVIASTAKKRVLPAMNVNMWNNPAVQRNIEQLKQDGVAILEPAVGALAEGYSGKGRFPDAEIVNAFISEPVEKTATTFSGKKIVVTAGGTREAIDPVRYIGNESSGKMGFALAQKAEQLGAQVILITGPTNLTLAEDSSIQRVNIKSVADLQVALERAVQDADILIMAAAVSDYRVAQVADHKMKKDDFNGELEIKLVENPDILANLKRPASLKYVVGFAAETNDLITNAERKIQKKKLNMIVANDVSNHQIGFESNQNAVTILRPNHANVELPQNDKTVIAEQILKLIDQEIN